MQSLEDDLKMKFRSGVYRGGPVIVSRLRKLLDGIDERIGKPSFAAMYRRFCRVVQEGDVEKMRRLQEGVSAAWNLSDEDTLASEVCVHEIAHVAIPYYFRSSVHCYPVRANIKDGTGRFGLHDLNWVPEYVISVLEISRPEVRALAIVACEWVLLCDLAGYVAEAILIEEEPGILIPFQSKEEGDLFNVKKLVTAIRGFDDGAYQDQMEIRCAEILTQPKMWEAIIVASSYLYERGEVDGVEVQEIFRLLRAPQYDFSSLRRVE